MARAYAKTATPEGVGPRTNSCEKFSVSANPPFVWLRYWPLGTSNETQKRCHRLHLPLQGGGRPRSGREGVPFSLAFLPNVRHDLESSCAEKGDDQSREQALEHAAS